MSFDQDDGVNWLEFVLNVIELIFNILSAFHSAA